LKDYHKDEVRALGRSLGLPADLVERQPFPGPGLAIRVICASTPFIGAGYDSTNAVLQYLSAGDASVLDAETAATVDKAVASAGFTGKLSDYSFTLLPVRTVGVQGDGRTYSYVCGLTKNKPVNDWTEVMNIAKLITRVCHEVNRVVYVWGEPITGSVKTITPTCLTPDVLDQLRQADAVVNELLVKHGLVTKVAQVPVVCVPVDPDFKGEGNSTRRSIAIRTFLTADFMTGVPVVPGNEISQEVLATMVEGISKVPGIARVLYDLTAKPPGTTEWE
jgi:GMP synthase (glutamine-hydrolysing)